MNKVKERLIEEIEILDDSNLFHLLDYARRMNNRVYKSNSIKHFNNDKVKKILNNLKGEISNDISELRSDRI